jgi:putative membrane protein
MYRTLLGTALLVGGLAMAQDPSQTQPASPPSTQQRPSDMPQTRPRTGSAEQDRSTATTMGENNRAMNQTNDKKFAMEAAMGGMAEVKKGQLAVEKASNPDVKAFGQKMVDDHTKANEELKEVASKESIDLPTSLDAKQQAMVDKLSKLSGAAFDKAYMKDMVKDHDTDVKEFQRVAQNGTDTAIRDFAAKTLPTLQEHQTMARDVQAKLSGKTTSADRSK